MLTRLALLFLCFTIVYAACPNKTPSDRTSGKSQGVYTGNEGTYSLNILDCVALSNYNQDTDSSTLPSDCFKAWGTPNWNHQDDAADCTILQHTRAHGDASDQGHQSNDHQLQELH